MDARQGAAAGIDLAPEAVHDGADHTAERPGGFGERAILHVDLDAFYSSVEQRDNASLRGKPVIVGGDPDRRGVVAAASYEARRHGVHSGLPCAAARRLCPEAVFLRPRFAVYASVSETVMEILRSLSPALERIAYDEAFVDISGRVVTVHAAEELGTSIQAAIVARVGLTASLGIAANKITAKVASDFRKPGGLTVVPAGEEANFLGPLPVRKLWGIGPRAEARLAAVGIRQVEQIAHASPEWVVAHFGHQGLHWQALARGEDSRPISTSTQRRQISRERTFDRDLTRLDALDTALLQMTAELMSDMESYPPARTLTMKIRYADFSTVTRQVSPGTVLTAANLAEQAKRLLADHWNGQPVRLLGAALSNFVEAVPNQLQLL